eukprot:gene9004-12146_t
MNYTKNRFVALSIFFLFILLLIILYHSLPIIKPNYTLEYAESQLTDAQRRQVEDMRMRRKIADKDFNMPSLGKTNRIANVEHEEVGIEPKKYLQEDTNGPKFTVAIKTGRNPAVKDLELQHRASNAMAAKFRSLVPYTIQMWYDNGRGGNEQGHLTLGQETTTNTYDGHVFFFTEFGKKDNLIGRYRMHHDQALYIIEDPKRPPPHDLKKRTQEEVEFMDAYFNRTGILWRHFYGLNGPRPKPTHFMWPANQVGEVHAVQSNNGFWLCEGQPKECQSQDPIEISLEVISVKPKAFVISQFLSDFEVESIKQIASPELRDSSVGDAATGILASETRTSKTAWIPRNRNHIFDTLFRRAGDVLQIEESKLTRGTAEDLQVVHYNVGQKYDSHHDWGVSGHPESRYLTLLLYLNDMANENAGGETAFPKGNDGLGIKVHPGKGKAVLFYNLLEDGNGDDLSLHAALPVRHGEKWLANFWVWDPKMK